MPGRHSLLAALLVGCRSTAPTEAPDVGVDAPIDSYVVDARPEAATDTAASDVADAGKDVGEFFKGTWGTPPGAPPECEGALSLEPHLAAPRLTFKPCASGRLGCRELVPDWPGEASRRLELFVREPVRLIDGRALFKIRRQSGASLEKIVFSMQTLDEPAAWAMRLRLVVGSPLCGGHMSANGAELSIASAASTASPGMIRLGRGAKSSDFTMMLLPLKDVVPSFESVSEFVAGPAGYYFHLSTPDSTATYDLTSKTFQVRYGWGENLVPVDDGVLALTSYTTLSVIRGDKAQTVVTASPGTELTWLDVDRRNNLLVWTEGVPTAIGFGAISLWYSPLPTKTTPLTPKKVGEFTETDLYFGGPFRANAGMVLLRTSPHDARVVRLVDGQTWRFATEPGTKFDPLWVDDDEAVLLTSVDAKPEYPSGMLRIRRDAMGFPGPF